MIHSRWARGAAGLAQACCLFFGTIVAPAARAAEPPTPAPAAAPDASVKQAYEEAQQAFEANDWGKALVAFAAAHRAAPTARALIHVGHCYRNLGDLDSAAGAYTMVIDQYPDHPLARRSRDLLLVIQGQQTPNRPMTTYPFPRLPDLPLKNPPPRHHAIQPPPDPVGFKDPVPPPPPPSSSSWPWWVAGGVAVAGGIVAAVLLGGSGKTVNAPSAVLNGK